MPAPLRCPYVKCLMPSAAQQTNFGHIYNDGVMQLNMVITFGPFSAGRILQPTIAGVYGGEPILDYEKLFRRLPLISALDDIADLPYVKDWFRHPRYDDYWKAFDNVSGPLWAIFSIRSKQGYYEYPKSPEGTCALMVPIWKEPNDNLELLKEFEINSTKDLPILVIFSKDKDDNILKQTIKLDDSSSDKAYSSIKKSLELVTKAIVKMMMPFKDKVLTITADNGKEFALHKKIAQQLEADVYFAHPYHSWERGLNENTNGLIRQYFPKKYDFRNITKQDIVFVEHRLNNRPRKILNFKKPSELFLNHSVALGT